VQRVVEKLLVVALPLSRVQEAFTRLDTYVFNA
jgi:hypothetical protein